jgi:hypothetical protein
LWCVDESNMRGTTPNTYIKGDHPTGVARRGVNERPKSMYGSTLFTEDSTEVTFRRSDVQYVFAVTPSQDNCNGIGVFD